MVGSTFLVERTNDYSIESKYSAVRKGYFKDDFIHHFFPHDAEAKNGTPLVNRGYWIRARAVEEAINKVRPDILIYIGSGSDTLALRYKDLEVIEVDLPHVMRRKIQVYRENGLVCELDEASSKLDKTSSKLDTIDSKLDTVTVELRTKNCSFISGDIRTEECVEVVVNEAKRHRQRLVDPVMDKTIDPVICIYNECTLCYLDEPVSENVIENLVSRMRHTLSPVSLTYIGYEQIRPENPPKNIPKHTPISKSDANFSTFMTHHFQSLGSPLKNLLSHTQIEERFKMLGSESIQVMDMNHFYDNLINDEEKKRIQSLEMFDEFEEFALLCSAYALTVASWPSRPQGGTRGFFSGANSSCARSERSPNAILETFPDAMSGRSLKSFQSSDELKRYGHCSCVTNDSKIILFGGVHSPSSSPFVLLRPESIFDVDVQKFSLNIPLNVQKVISKVPKDDLFGKFAQISQISNKFLLSGGRKSPSNSSPFDLILQFDEKNVEVVSKVPVERNVWRHSLTKVSEEQIVKIGGISTTGIVSSVQVFHFQNSNWISCSFNHPHLHRHSHAAVKVSNNSIVVSGGLSSNGIFDSIIKSSFILDMRANELKSLSGIPHLFSHKMAQVSDHEIAIVGGIEHASSNNSCLIYDMRNETIVDRIEIGRREKITLLHNFSLDVINKELVIIGGGGNCFTFGTHFNQDTFLITC